MRRLSFAVVVLGLVVAGVALGSRLPMIGAEEAPSPGQHGFVGAWQVTTLVEGQPPSPNLTTFYADGNVLTSNRPVFPPASEAAAAEARSAGHGVWIAVDDRTIDVVFDVLVSDVNGTYLGTRTLQGHLTLDETGTAWSGPFTARVTDPSGAVVATTVGRVEATRIVVVPLELVSTPVAA
jgi:hypothetical protein